MKKSLFVLSIIALLLIIFSLVSLVLMGMGLIPGGNWHFLVVATLAVAYFLMMIVLNLRRK